MNDSIPLSYDFLPNFWSSQYLGLADAWGLGRCHFLELQTSYEKEGGGREAVDAQMIYTFTPVSSSNWVLSGKCKFWNALLGQFVWDFCLILFAESESVFESKSSWFRYKRKWHRKYLGESESGREEEMWVIRGGNRGEDAAIIRR